MSTDYRLEKEIRFEEIFDGRLERHGVHENYVEGCTSDNSRALTDGRNYLWVYGDEKVQLLKRCGRNAPGKILIAIAETFGTDIYSEYDPQFWGFETQEEWDEAERRRNEIVKAETYADIMRYVQGEPNDITPGTIGETWANIVQKLISKDPGFSSPDRMDELMDTMRKIYDEEHAIVFEISDEDVAFANMIATHEDDLPQA
jgi:hypothetical protein